MAYAVIRPGCKIAALAADVLLEQRSNGTNEARGQLDHVAGVASNDGLNNMARMIERALVC